MRERVATPKDREPEEELFLDPRFLRIVEMFIAELRRGRRTEAEAYDLVLDAIGTRKTIRSIVAALDRVGQAGSHEGLVLVILRRRVIDLWRKQSRARRNKTAYLETDALDAALHKMGRLAPRTETDLVRGQVQRHTRRVLLAFCAQEPKHGGVLRRYGLEGACHRSLSREWGCLEVTARGRLHRALEAFRAYIERYHPELRDLWTSLMESL